MTMMRILGLRLSIEKEECEVCWSLLLSMNVASPPMSVSDGGGGGGDIDIR